MENELLVKLQHFFSADMMIKRTMYYMAPPTDADFLDEDSLCKYTDRAYERLNFIFKELKCIALDFYGIDSNIYKKIAEKEQTAKQAFMTCGIDIHRLRSFYREHISTMNKNFLDSVKEEFVGYAFNGSNASVSLAETTNELLHLIHSSIVNNDNLLEQIPLIKEKENDYHYPISLRGVEVETFDKVFEQFPSDLDVGYTDMVVIDENKMIMMVRDRGHALSIEITLKDHKAKVEYFIPKLCNIDMINRLPGINSVNKDSVGATGAIEVEEEFLASQLFDLISHVPTDGDMRIEYGDDMFSAAV